MADNESNILPQKPPWLEDQPEIKALLDKAIDRLNKNAAGKLGFTLKPTTLSGLFKQDEKADLTWSLLKTLFEGELAIFSFHEDRKRNHLDAIYTGARIRFIPEAEATVRQWLNRPVSESEPEKWKQRVNNSREQFPGDISRLSTSRIRVKGKTPEDILNGFISARCFWQDSKFLDNKEELLTLLYPQLKIITRPVIVNAMLPQKIQGVLFIENQDSYTQGITGDPDTLQHLALIYTAGFKLSAERIRSHNEASFHYQGKTHNKEAEQLTDWWYGSQKQDWPVYFWGDLDYAGMDILKKLKQRFDDVQAWQPGYQPMLECLLKGGGHTPEATGKQDQKDTGETGCNYADKQLLPALRKTGRFIDQEWVYQ